MFCRKEGWSHQGTRASMLFVLSILLLLASGCAAVRISPAALKASTVRTNEAVADLRRWQEAVYLCNLFLNSTNRKTLPPGQLRLTDDGMEFTTANSTLPIRIRCSDWGDVLVWYGMAAQ